MQCRVHFSQEQEMQQKVRLYSTALRISSEMRIERGLRLTPAHARGRELGAGNLCVGRALLLGGSTTRQGDFVRERLFCTLSARQRNS